MTTNEQIIELREMRAKCNGMCDYWQEKTDRIDAEIMALAEGEAERAMKETGNG